MINTNNNINTPRIDTPLNTWLKNLDNKKKKAFYRNLLKSPMLWEEKKTKERKRWAFNNYRKIGLTGVPQAIKIQIFICALSVEPNLKIQKIFPEINIDYARPIMVALKMFAQNLYSTYVENKEEQSHCIDA